MSFDSRGKIPEGDAFDERIPLVILTGFLGAGKTTVLNHILRHVDGRKIAALVNDVGEVNIDAALTNSVTEVDERSCEDVVELSNGCICCGIQGAFGEAVMKLVRQKPDCIVVEATGIAEPQGIVASLAARDDEGASPLDFVRIANVATVVDAGWWEKKMKESYTPVRRSLLLISDPRRPLSELLVTQIECASVIVLNKADLADQGMLARSQSALATLNPEAELLLTQEGAVDPGELFDVQRFEYRKTIRSSGVELKLMGESSNHRGSVASHDHGDFGLISFVYRARSPLKHSKLIETLRRGIPGLLRAKGFVWTDREPDHVGFLSLAGDVLRFDHLGKWIHAKIHDGELDRSQIGPDAWRHWDPNTGDRRQEIVFIGIDLDRDAITAQLDDLRIDC